LEALLGTLPESSRAALQQLVSGRTLRLAKLGADITTATVGWSPSGVLRTKGALV
jgi:hypothetical protein